MKAAGERIRKIISDLKATLKEIGMEDVLIRQRRQVAVRRDLIDCDYYRMLDGDMTAVNAYRGEYMADYSWAEITAGRLHFRYAPKIKNITQELSVTEAENTRENGTVCWPYHFVF